MKELEPILWKKISQNVISVKNDNLLKYLTTCRNRMTFMIRNLFLCYFCVIVFYKKFVNWILFLLFIFVSYLLLNLLFSLLFIMGVMQQLYISYAVALH